MMILEKGMSSILNNRRGIKAFIAILVDGRNQLAGKSSKLAGKSTKVAGKSMEPARKYELHQMILKLNLPFPRKQT
jgi:hypothetical protein